MTMDVVYHEITKFSPLTIDQVREALASKGCKPKRDSNGFRAVCPAHTGADGLNLTVHPKDGGGVLMRCHSKGCDYESIVKALGLWDTTSQSLIEGAGAASEAYSSAFYMDGGNTVYQYQDAQGGNLYQNVRKAQKGFFARRYDAEGNAILNLSGVRQVPYGLPELVAPKNRHAVVFVTEGEKDAIRLRDNGFLAISIADVALTDENAEKLQGRQVVIVEDNDEAGRKKSEKRVEWALPVAKSVKLMRFTELPEKGDASDYFDNGGTADDFRERVAALPVIGNVSSEPVWTIPDPLQAEFGPDIDPALLTGDFRAFCEHKAVEYQVPLDMVATIALGVISAAAGGQYTAYRWNEPIHGMFVVGARPGSRKSAIIASVSAPLLKWQADQQSRDRLEIANWESTERALTKSRDRLEGEPRKGESSGENRDLLRRAAVNELHEHQENRPVLTTLVVDDATPQAVAWHLIEQRGVAVVSAESAYLENFYRYGDSPDYNAFLQGHAGEALRVDRRGGQSASTERACLSLCLAIQPHAIKRMGGVDGFMQRGGPERLLIALPKDNAGRRLTGRNVPTTPEHLKAWWEASIFRILNSRDQNEGTTQIDMTPDAFDAAERFETVIEDRLGFMSDADQMRGWTSKQSGAAIRIAGLLHLIHHNSSEPIDASTMTRGISLSEWFRVHTSIAYSMMDDTGDDLARIVLAAIVEGGGVAMNRRDIHIKLRGQAAFKKAADLDAPIELLERFGYIRIRKVETGGRPAEWIDVNPLALPTKTSPSSRAEISQMYRPDLEATGTEGKSSRIVEEF